MVSTGEDIVTAFVAFGAAIAGAFSGVSLQHRVQKQDAQRGAHLEDIKRFCLVPLSKSLDSLYSAELFLSEDMPTLALEISAVLSREELVKTYGGQRGILMFQAPALEIHAELYDDLSVHFPTIKKAADLLDSGSGGAHAEYAVSRYLLFSEINGLVAADRDRNPPGPLLGRQPARLQALGRALFFAAIKKPNTEWPNLYSTLKADIDRIVPSLEDPEIGRLAEEFNGARKLLVEEWSGLKQALDTAIDSYKPLRGRCKFVD